MICRICANEHNNESLVARDILHDINREFEYYRCSSCGCLQIAQVPSDMSCFYGESYYSLQADPFDKLNFSEKLFDRLKDYLIFFHSRRACGLSSKSPIHRKWLTMVPWDKDKSILDVGCGHGVLLRRLHRLGFKKLCGIDAFIDKDIVIGEDCWLRKRTLENTEGQFDLIILSHSLEHMSDQHSAMASVKRLLAPGGKVVVLIPIFSTYFYEKYNDCWYSWDVPRHFYLHSLESVGRLASDSGLNVEKRVLYSFLNCILESERRLAKFRSDSQAILRIKNYTLSDWRRETNRINSQSKSDCCNFLLTHL